MTDTRRVFLKADDNQWQQIELKHAPEGALLAIIDDPDLGPDDVQHWVTTGLPYQQPNGLWTINVVPASEDHKGLSPKR